MEREWGKKEGQRKREGGDREIDRERGGNAKR